MKTTLPIAVTMGEPAGVGGEILLKSWLNKGDQGLPPFFAIDDTSRLDALALRLGLKIPIKTISAPNECAHTFGHALPVLECPLKVQSVPGHCDPENAASVLKSIEMAVELAGQGNARAVVTSPIQKSSLYEAGFTFPGHTEFLAHLCQTQGWSDVLPKPLMMLSIPELRVVPVTIHVALKDAIKELSIEKIVGVGKLLNGALQLDFGIPLPRLAVAGLNPHAGEQGSLGREEVEIIAVAVSQLQEQGINVTGPSPADTLFHAHARQEYDGVLCMYHDQALIPLKTIDFDRGVNSTLGLPIVRTSPDHGTALDIAGTGRASPTSFQEALHMAAFIADRRSSAAEQ
jgi:4-hydroxythreonine-4-phosphate dehydrogenase